MEVFQTKMTKINNNSEMKTQGLQMPETKLITEIKIVSYSLSGYIFSYKIILFISFYKSLDRDKGDLRFSPLRWIMLCCACGFLIGSYYCYDIPGPIES